VYDQINVTNRQSKYVQMFRLIRALIFLRVRARSQFSMLGRGSTISRFYFCWNQRESGKHQRRWNGRPRSSMCWPDQTKVDDHGDGGFAS